MTVDQYSGAALRERMEQAGLTAGELAKRIGVQRNTVSRWLNGARTPAADLPTAIDRAIAGLPARVGLGPRQFKAIQDAAAVLDLIDNTVIEDEGGALTYAANADELWQEIAKISPRGVAELRIRLADVLAGRDR